MMMLIIGRRFWLLDCQQVSESTRLSSELYRDVIAVPFISQVVVFAKRRSMIEAHLRIYCVTDDRLDKTLETREHYREVARSRGIEVTIQLFRIQFLSTDMALAHPEIWNGECRGIPSPLPSPFSHFPFPLSL